MNTLENENNNCEQKCDELEAVGLDVKENIQLEEDYGKPSADKKRTKLIIVAILTVVVIVGVCCMPKVVSNISVVNASKEAYKLGCKYYEEEDWKRALESFEKVIPKDKNYEEAQSNLEKCKEIYYFKEIYKQKGVEIPNFIHIAKASSYSLKTYEFTPSVLIYEYKNTSLDEVLQYVEFLQEKMGFSYTYGEHTLFSTRGIVFTVDCKNGDHMLISCFPDTNDVEIIYDLNG